jgi:hypothetical protein
MGRIAVWRFVAACAPRSRELRSAVMSRVAATWVTAALSRRFRALRAVKAGGKGNRRRAGDDITLRAVVLPLMSGSFMRARFADQCRGRRGNHWARAIDMMEPPDAPRCSAWVRAAFPERCCSRIASIRIASRRTHRPAVVRAAGSGRSLISRRHRDRAEHPLHAVVRRPPRDASRRST